MDGECNSGAGRTESTFILGRTSLQRDNNLLKKEIAEIKESVKIMRDQAIVAENLAMKATNTIHSLQRANMFLEAALVGSRFHASHKQSFTSENDDRDADDLETISLSSFLGCSDSDGYIEDSNEVRSEKGKYEIKQKRSNDSNDCDHDYGHPSHLPTSRKITLTAKGEEASGVYNRCSSSLVLLTFKDMFPSALLQQRRSLKSLVLCYSALKSDVRRDFFSFQDDMFLKFHLIASNLEKMHSLLLHQSRQQHAERRHRRNSSCSDSSRMSDILAAEKRHNNATPLTSRLTAMCSRLPIDPSSGSLIQLSPTCLHVDNNYFPHNQAVGKLVLRTFSGSRGEEYPATSSTSAVAAGPLEVLWQFKFSLLNMKEQQPPSWQSSDGHDEDTVGIISAAKFEAVTTVTSDTFTYACKLWKLACIKNMNYCDMSDSSDIQRLAATYDIKLVRVSEINEMNINIDMSSCADEQEGEKEEGEDDQQQLYRHQSMTRTPRVRLKSEFRLQGKHLLGKPIIRKLFADVDMLQLHSCTSNRSKLPAAPVVPGGGLLFGPDSHLIEEAMLNRFLSSGNLVISALLMIERA